MEEILIKKLDLKPSGMLIVGMNGNREYTMNQKWQSQEIDFLMKDVGIGGSVEVELTQKPNMSNPASPYHNITKVNMESGKKGLGAPVEKIVDVQTAPQETKGLMSVKVKQITADVLLKGAIEMAKGHQFESVQDEAKYMCEAVNELRGVLSYAMSILD